VTSRWALLAVSVLAVLGLYGRALDYQLAWMDETEIGAGAIVLAPGESWTRAFTRPLHASAQGVNPYYRPLQIVVATAVHRVAGPAPRFYRAVLLGLAIGTCTAFGALALLLFESVPLAVAATLVAAAHPAMIEAWVWISGLGESLAGCFALASVGCGALVLAGRGGRAGLALSLASLLLALLSKEKAVVVPALLAALALARGGVRGLAGDRSAAGLVGAGFGIVTLYLVARPLLMGRGLAAAAPIGGDWGTHLLSALASWPAGFLWLLFPLHSSASDGVAIVRSAADPRVWLGALLPLASLAAAVLLARRGRPVAAFGLAWIWIAFLPTANLFPQIHARAERYWFLSVFGWALLAVDLFDALAARAAPRARASVAAGVGVALALFLAGRTWTRTPDWQSTESLFRADLVRDPDFREGRFHLAGVLIAARRFGEADAELRRLREAPGARTGYVNAIGVEQLACAVDVGLGRNAQALADFARAERDVPGAAADPGLRSCAAQALEAMGRSAEAAAFYERVVASLGASEPPAAVSLALARNLAKLGRRDEARAWLERARRTAPPRDVAFDFQLRQVEKQLR
jgi:tetratricopeptide (TPR) repeat protein